MIAINIVLELIAEQAPAPPHGPESPAVRPYGQHAQLRVLPAEPRPPEHTQTVRGWRRNLPTVLYQGPCHNSGSEASAGGA